MPARVALRKSGSTLALVVKAGVRLVARATAAAPLDSRGGMRLLLMVPDA